jgi:hypothetical protein
VLAREGELRNEANLPTSFCWRPGTDHLIDRINAWDSRIRARNCRRSSMASRVNRPCFSAFCCRVAHPNLPPRHASDNVSCRLRPDTCKVSQSAFSPRSVGSTASDRYYADGR